MKGVTTLRVVLADDEAAVRALLGIALGMEGGFTVVGEAADGEQAVALVDESHPNAIVLDLMMPGLSGLEAIPFIRSRSPETKIVVFSALSAAQMCAECMQKGADAYVEKTRVITDLSETLHRVCTAA
jgi:DNA-binding NarL/FixJ family response regulator